MSLHVRPLIPTDYEETLVGWWEDWKWQAPMKDFLPMDGIGGMIVYDDETPVCAGFMYMTNSKVFWVDWIISNKKYTYKQSRRESLLLLINTLCGVAEKNGALYIYALIKNPSLIQKYEELGFVKGDSYTSEMIKKIK
jgi:hypothetical protein